MNLDNILTIEYIKSGYKNNEFTPYDIMREIEKRAVETRDMNIWIQAPNMEKIKPYIDRIMALDQEKTPLWGVPFAIKDNIDLEKVITSAGCNTYSYLPEESATVVKLLIEAGAIPVGKTNLDQFATGLVGTRSLFGATHNAMRPELISGGSSSGSAVSVAMGQAAFSLGTDTAGSGRVPAALNNLVGFKPSVGAWSTKGLVPACASLDCITVFTHNLDDAKLIDDIVRVYDENCPWSRKVKAVKYSLPLKICIPKEELTFYGDFQKEFRASWKRVIREIQELGIKVEYIDYSIFKEAASILYDGPWIAERWSSLGDFVEQNNGESMVDVVEKILRSGNKENLKADSVFKAIHRLSEIKCEVKKLLKDRVLLMPTVGGTYTIEEVNGNPIETNNNMGLYTNHCNLLELSALNFQAGFAQEKLPFGVTSFALAEEDGLNLGIAKLYHTFSKQDKVYIAVCGLHMRGMPLEHQLLNLGATFVKEDKTSPEYKLFKLNTVPIKPGLTRVNADGNSIELEVWQISVRKLGEFLTTIKTPLGLGEIKLENGDMVVGFLCEESATREAEDISHYRSFRNVM